MKTLETIVVAAACVCLLAPGTAQAQGGKATKYPVVPLSVVIEPAVTPTAENPAGIPAITGDAAAYEDGEARLRTVIDEFGNLILAFGRDVYFHYGNPLPETRAGTVADEPSSGAKSNAYISSLPRSGEGPLQLLVAGSSQCVRLNWQYDHAAGGWWRHGFNRGTTNAENGTSYAVVSRVDENTWTVEPRGGQDCGFTNLDSLAQVFTHRSVKGKTTFLDYGDYYLPYKLTLTRKAP